MTTFCLKHGPSGDSMSQLVCPLCEQDQRSAADAATRKEVMQDDRPARDGANAVTGERASDKHAPAVPSSPSDAELDGLIEMANAASHDERLSDGMLYRNLAAALTALRAERDNLDLSWTQCERMRYDERQELKARAEQAERELAEARKDAERYRWLRERGWYPAQFTDHLGSMQGPQSEYEDARQLAVDAAIDAAREGEGSPTRD